MGVLCGAMELDSVAAARTEPAALAGLELVSLAKAPIARIKKRGMIALKAKVRNSGDSTATGQLVGRIAGQEEEEDRRQIELLPGEESIFDIHLRISAKTVSNPLSVSVTLNVIENGLEVILQKQNQPVAQTLTYQFDDELVATAIALTKEPEDVVFWRWPQAEAYASYELVTASRIDLGLSRRCLLLDNAPMPLSSVDWTGIETLVLGKPETLMDASAVAALQAFMQRGGHVLVMLDEVDTELVRPLMVDNQQCETIDTVELNHIVMEVNTPALLDLKDRTIDSDQALKLKRVLQQGGRVTHTIDGWPAVIFMRVGDGELILTALESKAWLRPRYAQSTDTRSQANFTAPLWEGTVSSSLNSVKLDEPFEVDQAAYPIQMIGSPVVPRQWVGAILIGFCVLLGLAGIATAFAGDLRRIGLIAPAIALLSTLPLVYASTRTRSEIPPLSSELQFVQFWPNGGGLIRSKGAVYLNASRSMGLVGKSDGFAIPSENIESGVRSLLTKDFESWQLSNNDWPPGTWRYQSEVALSQGAYVAKSRLTEKGLEIDLPEGLPSTPEDLVVNFNPGSPSLVRSVVQDKRVLLDGELPADGNRWTSSAIVSDEQGRRAAVYTSHFSPSETRRSPTPRSLFFWTKRWPEAPNWNSPLDNRGAALVSVPIELTLPDAGSSVYIPYSLIKVEPQEGKMAVSTIYNYRTGYWAGESALDAVADMSFVLPPEAVPLEATAIHIDWDIEAPKRNAKLVWSSKNSPIDIVAMNSPSIPWRGTIDNPRVLKDLSDGRLDLSIEVTSDKSSDPSSQNSFITWKTKHLRISVSGKTLPRNNLVKPIAK